MRIQRTGPESLLLVLDEGEAENGIELRRMAAAALRRAGIPSRERCRLTAYSAGGRTLVFVSAGETADTYYGFSDAQDLLDAACEADRLFPGAEASLCRRGGRLYLVTADGGAGELLREYAAEVLRGAQIPENREVILKEKAFQILSGRC